MGVESIVESTVEIGTNPKNKTSVIRTHILSVLFYVLVISIPRNLGLYNMLVDLTGIDRHPFLALLVDRFVRPQGVAPIEIHHVSIAISYQDLFQFVLGTFDR